MKVSVVMCTYQGAKYLEAQLQSIVTQTYPIAELLIFDDHSSDDTFAILQRFATHHSFVQCYQNPTRLGFTKNFEQALLKANGDVIAIADQDDIWLPTKIADLIAVWHTDSPIIYCDSQRFTGLPPSHATPAKNYRRFQGNQPQKLFFFNTISGHALLVKKEFLSHVLPFSEGIYYDWQMAVTACQHGGVQYLPKTLVLQRVHGKNESIDTQGNHESFLRYRQQVAHHLQFFVQRAGLPTQAANLATQLAQFLQNTQPTTAQKWHAFVCILRHAATLFQYKKKVFPYFSYIKHAYKWAFN